MDVKVRTPLFLLLVYHNFIFSFAIQTISPTQLVIDSDSIVSLNQTFRLGFFSPDNTTNRYVGIWYNRLPGEMIVVWVANRENPLPDSAGVLKINDDDGNLVLLDGNQRVVWTTNISVATNSSEARLLDSGNFVLREISSERILWQSFEYPTDTILEDMRIGINTRTGGKQVLASWKTNSDPSRGQFHLELESLNIPQFVLWNGMKRHWRSGPWDGNVFNGVEGMASNYLNGFSVVRDEQEESVYVILSYQNSVSPVTVRYVLNSIGQISEKRFYEGENHWVDYWSAPQKECDFYGKCGPFGFCNLKSEPVCSCFSGYEPSSVEEWNKGNWSSGCVKRTPLRCDREASDDMEVKEDGFVKHERMKVPDFANWMRGWDSEDCRQTCILNCSCIAYSHRSDFGCMLWNGALIDAEKYSTYGLSTDGLDVYIRVAHSELAKKNNVKVIASVTTVAGLLTFGLCIYIIWRCRKKQTENKKKCMEVLVLGKSGSHREFADSDKLDPELPIFKYETLAVATDYFKLSNKLGEGGFGSVYKGKLSSGQDIAVKRLSKSSGQGTEEFKNEVVVISGLQHRNLVRLLGCCIEGDEKMLIYEYMPNKSLDSFLFDPTKKACLDWRKCFQIIEGIGRGILYLHRDSRLKVIHRDLKPSNILLDANLNPKISDFGMARIFGSDEMQANTRRVVGTYGYMSPEYAMEGLFSEKSDVYSFGVLLLEIVSGMRNNGFHHHQESSSLILHVWRLWNEDRTEELIDPRVSEPSFKEEIIRCIHVGLLCVQDFAKDRPNMSLIISMLTSEITGLPSPKKPAFIDRQVTTDSGSFCGSNNNIVSITTLQGR